MATVNAWLRDGSYADFPESQWTWTWEGSPATTRTSRFPTRGSVRGHHSLPSQELRSRHSFKGRRSMTDLWNGTGLLPNKNPAPTWFQKDTEDQTLKAQRLRLGLPEHAQSGTDGDQRKAWCRLLPGSEGPALSPRPEIVPTVSLEFQGASAPQREHLVLPSGAKEPSSPPASHPRPDCVGVFLGSTHGFKDLDSEGT